MIRSGINDIHIYTPRTLVYNIGAMSELMGCML